MQLVDQYRHIVRDDTVNAIGGPDDLVGGRGAGSAASSVGTQQRQTKGTTRANRSRESFIAEGRRISRKRVL